MASPHIVASAETVAAPAVVQPRAAVRRRRDEPLTPGPLGHDALHVTGPDPRITAHVNAYDTVVRAHPAAAGPAPAREEH